MKVELGGKTVGLCLLGEVAQLGKVSVDHYNLGVEISLAVGDEDAASRLVGRVILLVEPYAGFFTRANVFLGIKDVGKVTGHCAPVNQT
jgi:hypothetical protein